MHVIGEMWAALMAAIPSIGMIVAVVIMGLAMKGNGMNSEERALHKRQKQGGLVWNDYLEELRKIHRRQKEQCVNRLMDSDVSDKDRQIYGNAIRLSESALDYIERMGVMKGPDDD